MSDLLWWVLQPSGLLVTLLLFGSLLAMFGAGRFAGRVLGLVALGWIALVIVPIDAYLAAPLEARHDLPEALPQDVDGILVLGGAVDWWASEEAGQLVLLESAERLVAGAALAQRYPDADLVLGAVTPRAVEGNFTLEPGPASFFFGDAYAQRRPLLLPSPQSTYEEATTFLRRVAPRTGDTWILITSALHMPRAWATFSSQGVSMIPYPVDPVSKGARIAWPDLPSAARKLHDLDRVVREWGAVLVYRRTGRIHDAVWRSAPDDAAALTAAASPQASTDPPTVTPADPAP